MNPHSLNKKRELGAYYTPPELSQVLVDWAILSRLENILEPSFGGCGFFESCIKKLESLGCKTPSEQLYGVDIDPHAFNILSQKFGKTVSLDKRFLHSDFISVSPGQFLVPDFDVVLGNPPYVSMHNMSLEQRRRCEKTFKASPFIKQTMGRNVSLWAFFLLHSLSFLKNGGKVAWVLPSSLLHTDYSKKLIEVHKQHFKRVKIAKLAERFFVSEGAQETSIVLIAEGFSKTASNTGCLEISSVHNIEELHEFIHAPIDQNKLNHFDNYKISLLSKEISDSYFQVEKNQVSKKLIDYLNIKIGMVTGANKFFIINKETIEKNNLDSSYLRPIVSRFSCLVGIRHNKLRQRENEGNNLRSYLLNPCNEDMKEKNTPVRNYLAQISAKERRHNKTFPKRANWYTPDDNIYPDAFFSYMSHLGPRIVLNQGKINCTNSIHKVFFNERLSHRNKLAISISLLSSYSQLSAEIEARSYSSGVLKIEPTAGKNIRILMSDRCIQDLASNVTSIESLLTQDKQLEMTTLIDNIFIKHGILTREQCDLFREGVRILRRERYKGVKTYDE